MADIVAIGLTIAGLAMFEIITSLDNAVINAEVLTTVSARLRRFFLTWGILVAVFLVRGLLPLVLVMAAHPGLGLYEALTYGLDGNTGVFEASAGPLLIAGGVFLVFVFLHWLFMEPKIYGLHAERFFHRLNVWFYAAVSIFLAVLVWYAIKLDPILAFGAVVGSTGFFIIHGFRQNAEKMEHTMLHGKDGKGGKDLAGWSKILYLEAIDASFSIDGVVGAFAFTLVVPFIIIGNGIGAIAVRELTVKNIEAIKKYRYLKHGAMYSIFALGMIMILDSFGYHVPQWLAPLVTFASLGYFFWKSKKEINVPLMDAKAPVNK
jgi:hypothetical protein